MGEKAKRIRRLGLAAGATTEAEIVTVDLGSPDYVMTKSNLENLRRMPDGTDGSDEDAYANATRALVTQLINGPGGQPSPVFPSGMDRTERKKWAVWQELLDGETTAITLPRGHVTWLYQLLSAQSLRTAPGLAQWLEAFLKYVEEKVLTKADPTA